MSSRSPSLQNIVCSDNSLGTNNPRTEDSNSLFGDGSCGEPLITQHLVIDFTPGDEDNEYVQKKCCAFWDFIEGFPELQDLIVLPDPITYKASPTTPSSSTSQSSAAVRSSESDHLVGRTAVSMLRFAEDKGLIDRTFEAKLPQSVCSLGPREYIVDDSHHKIPSLTNTKSVCSCGAECAICQTRRSSQPISPSSTKVGELCNMMQDFDEKNPKSLTPPGHAPALSHSIMQRKIKKY